MTLSPFCTDVFANRTVSNLTATVSNTSELLTKKEIAELIYQHKKAMVEVEAPYRIFQNLAVVLGLPMNMVMLAVYMTGHRMRFSIKYFVQALAIYDMVALTSGMGLNLEWVQSPDHIIMCRLFNFALLLADIGSMLTLLCIAMDRYLHVVQPLSRKITQERQATALVGCLVLGAVCAFPSLVFYGTVEYNHQLNTVVETRCQYMKEYWNTSLLIAWRAALLVIFLIIFSIIGYLNQAVIKKVWLQMMFRTKLLKLLKAPVTLLTKNKDKLTPAAKREKADQPNQLAKPVSSTKLAQTTSELKPPEPGDAERSTPVTLDDDDPTRTGTIVADGGGSLRVSLAILTGEASYHSFSRKSTADQSVQPQEGRVSGVDANYPTTQEGEDYQGGGRSESRTAETFVTLEKGKRHWRVSSLSPSDGNKFGKIEEADPKSGNAVQTKKGAAGQTKKGNKKKRRVAAKVRTSVTRRGILESSHDVFVRKTYEVTASIVLVTVLFFVSFFPHFLLATLIAADKLQGETAFCEPVLYAVVQISLRSEFINFVFNPLVYSFTSSAFQDEYNRLLNRFLR